MAAQRLYTPDPKSIHARVLELDLPAKGANSKRSKVETLVYAAFDEGRAEEREKAKCNGWTNYATWAINLWMDNEQGTQEYWQRQARELWDDCKPNADYEGQTREQIFLYRLSEYLKSEHEEHAPETTGVYADLLTSALGLVNWYEIAEHYLDAVKEGETNE